MDASSEGEPVATHTHTQSLHVSSCLTVCISESDEDEADIITRDALKRQSRLIVDSKSKKKPWKKKGKF